MASQPKNTALCAIVWRVYGAEVDPPTAPCTDSQIDDAIASADIVGIDAPFGWPMAFAAAVTTWADSVWNNAVRDKMCFRVTDEHVRASAKKVPLSVSSDKIALPAMRTMALLHRHRVADKSGDGRFYEVYPAATLKRWGLPHQGYKAGPRDQMYTLRLHILNKLRAEAPSLKVPDDYAVSDHAFDALIAALSARAAALGNTEQAPPIQAKEAAREGWIHIPNGSLRESVGLT